MDVSKHPINEQSEAIDQSFHRWKTTNGQTDDVLLIGFQII